MQKWEYKTILRSHGWKQVETGEKGMLAHRYYDWMQAGDWNVDVKLEQLGADGWELVTVVPRSSILGGRGAVTDFSYNYAGFTDQELWVFKRPKS